MNSRRMIGYCPKRSVNFRLRAGYCPRRSENSHRRTGCCQLTNGSCPRRTGFPRPNEFGVLKIGRDYCQLNSASEKSNLAATKIRMATLRGGCSARSWTRALSPAESCQLFLSLFAAPPALANPSKSQCLLHPTMSRRCCHKGLVGRRWVERPAMSSTSEKETRPL